MRDQKNNTIYHLPSTIYHLPSTIYHLPSTIYHLPSTIYLLSLIVISTFSYSANAALCPPTTPTTGCATNSTVTVGGVTQNRDGAAVGNDIVSSAGVTNSSGSVSADASANYGVLKAKASASTTALGTNSASSSATAVFNDTLTISSGTLNPNTPLQIEMRVWLDGLTTLNKGSFIDTTGLNEAPPVVSSVNLSLSETPISGGPAGSPSFSTETSQNLGPGDLKNAGGVSFIKTYDINNTLSSTTFNAFVGETFRIQGIMTLLEVAANGTNVTANFFDTGHFAFVVLGGQDVTILGNSGINYTPAAVPLPGALLFFLTGLFGLGGVANRRRL